MKKSAEEITKGFFQALFGKLIADLLFEQKLKKFGVSDFNSISNRKKLLLGQKIIEDTFREFYSFEKIENMKLLYLLRFSLNEAGGRVEEMIGKECEIMLDSAQELDSISSEDLIKNMEDDKNVKFVFEWSEMLEGDLVIILDKETTLKFAKIFMEASMGLEIEGNTLDDMKLSALNEFFNIILPVFSRVIGESFSQMILFTPIDYRTFKSKYYFMDEFIIPQKIIYTPISFMIDNNQNKGQLFLFIKEATGRFKALIDQAQLHKDPFEQSPPRVFVKLTGDTRSDMNKFFELLNIDKSHIDYLLKSVYKPNFSNFSYTDFIKFYQTLITDFLPNASENKKEAIKLNLSHIFGLQK